MRRAVIAIWCSVVAVLIGCCSRRAELNYAEERPSAQQLAGEYRLTASSAALAGRILNVPPPNHAKVRILSNGTFEATDVPRVLGWGVPVGSPIAQMHGFWRLTREPDGWTMHLITTREMDFTDTAGVQSDKVMFIEGNQPPHRLHFAWASEGKLIFEQR